MIPLPSLLAAVRDHPFEVPSLATLSVTLDAPIALVKRTARQAVDRRLVNIRGDGSITLTGAGLALIGARRAPSRR